MYAQWNQLSWRIRLNKKQNVTSPNTKPLKSTTFRLLCFFFLTVVPGCTTMNLAMNLKGAVSDVQSGRYEEAIPKCEEFLVKNKVSNPLMVRFSEVRVNADYLVNVCLGASYGEIGNYEKSSLLNLWRLFSWMQMLMNWRRICDCPCRLKRMNKRKRPQDYCLVT